MNIQERLQGLYFFQMYRGSYSDYSVGGIYACDHEVTEVEWDGYYKAYQDLLDAKREEMITATDPWHINRDWRSSEHVAAAVVWCAQHDAFEGWRDTIGEPEETFAALHNMVLVESTEFWRDC